jgi:uncharacterized protein (DUF2062 family)
MQAGQHQPHLDNFVEELTVDEKILRGEGDIELEVKQKDPFRRAKTQMTFRFKLPTLAEVRRTMRYHKLNVVHRSRDPHPAATSFAIGVFLGFMPISVFATVLAVVLPRWFSLRTIPCVVGTFTSNWITAPFILAASAMMGQLLTKGHIAGFRAMLPPEDFGLRETFLFLLDQGWAFMLGITVVSLLAAIVSYAIVYWSVECAIKLRQAKGMERMHSHIHLPHVHLPRHTDVDSQKTNDIPPRNEQNPDKACRTSSHKEPPSSCEVVDRMSLYWKENLQRLYKTKS